MPQNRSSASVSLTQQEDEHGNERDCVIATCNESGESTEPIWGHGSASVKRALAQLSEHCSCTANWHYDEDGDDD